MDKPLNWGILGASKFARQHMGPAIHAASGCRLMGLATSSPEKAKPFVGFCPDLQVYADYEALLADDRIDAVYIPLPNHLHVEWSKKALRAGKHVLCEKPIALRASEIDELMVLGDQTGLHIAEAFMIVHHPQWIRARELFQDGVLGNLRHVDGVFSYFNDDMDNIRNQAQFGGGGIRDIGVYTYGSVRFVTGAEPVKVTHTKIQWENGVDIDAHIWADFPGFTYSAQTSMRRHARQEMVFHGDAGLMRLTAPFSAEVFGDPRIEVIRAGKPDLIERFSAARHYQIQVENFAGAVAGGTAYPWTLEDARGTQAMIDMVFEADKTAP